MSTATKPTQVPLAVAVVIALCLEALFVPLAVVMFLFVRPIAMTALLAAVVVFGLRALGRWATSLHAHGLRHQSS